MTKHDFDRFSGVMLGLAENYGQSLSPQGIAIRFKALEGYEIDEVDKAAMSLILTRKYTTMPTVADFLEHITGGSAEDKAEVEAGKVLTAIQIHGGYDSVVFDDSVTQAVIVRAYGGWAQLCDDCGRDEPVKWFRKEFAKTWAAYARQGVKQTGYLPGIIEISNRANGYFDDIPVPKIIGNEDKARAILEAGNRDALEENSVRRLCLSLPLNEKKDSA
ncbi:hypothetical protein FACS1894206_05800 [Deltaproteobacteria bacterium]|nr:hypothetical protein FACS1894206_05800 [Deltaproteobacteria bacterium]